MKVVHVLKRIEMIDEDIKELRKLEKTITRDKSFSTPIYMSIEKQINLLLGERIKLIELQILNPPENYVTEIEGTPEERKVEPIKRTHTASSKKKSANAAPKTKPEPELPAPKFKGAEPDEDGMVMFTQDMIDSRFSSAKKQQGDISQNNEDSNSASRKLLDDALTKSSLSKKLADKPVTKPARVDRPREVKFFRGNFPTD